MLKRSLVSLITYIFLTSCLCAMDNQNSELLQIVDLNDENNDHNTISQMNYSSHSNPKRCSLKKILKTPLCCDPYTNWEEAIQIGSTVVTLGTGFLTACTWCESFFCFDASCNRSCQLAWIGVNDCSSRGSTCCSVMTDVKTALLGISFVISGICMVNDPCTQNNLKCCKRSDDIDSV